MAISDHTMADTSAVEGFLLWAIHVANVEQLLSVSDCKLFLLTLPTAGEHTKDLTFSQTRPRKFTTRNPASHLVLFHLSWATANHKPVIRRSWPIAKTPGGSLPSQDRGQHEWSERGNVI